mgnify:CR=1 FL=1
MPKPPDFIDITDPRDPRLDVYRNQRDAWLRAAHNPEANAQANPQANPPADPLPGLFMAEGELVIHHLVRSRYRPASVFCTPARGESMAADLARLPAGTPIYRAEPAVMGEVCGFNIHRGVLAAAHRSAAVADPTRPTSTLDRLSERCRALVVLEDLSNHDNVGSVFRSAAALAGLHDETEPQPNGVGVVLSPRCCDPLYRKAIRVSMGLALRVPFVHATDWPAPLDRLRERGWSLIALAGGGEATLADLGPVAKPALLLGAEGPGLSGAALGSAATRARIPMHPGVDSLNVAVAGAIALAHLVPPAPPSA